MEGHPVILRPEGTILPMIALGGAGGIHQDSNAPEQVIKAPLKHNVQGCTQEVIEMVESTEEFSNLCIDREKLIYQALPKDPNILNCIAITERGIHVPYLRQGNVRQYLQTHSLDAQTRDRWIGSAIDAIITIHTYGIIHSDISARNFLVDDDLSIKLCDFAGSGINDLESLVGEESAYHSSPSLPRTFQTDIFALGSLIYEISTGIRPFADIDDDEIEKRYTAQHFPSLRGVFYHDVISKCWRSQYRSVEALKRDIPCSKHASYGRAIFSHIFWASTLAMVSVGCTVVYAFGKQRVR